MPSEPPRSPAQISNTSGDAVAQAIAKYSAGLPALVAPTTESRPSRFIVLLTGSTGNVGAHLLAFLLTHPQVARVYAYNRPSSSNACILDRQNLQCTAHGLDHGLLSSKKLVFLEGNLHAAQLGLQRHEYDELLAQVNLVIHNAWHANFTLSLPDYEPLIAGSRNLIDFARASRQCSDSLRFVFVSSIVSVYSWKHPGIPVPEVPLSDPAVALGMGYGESKYVVERILLNSGLRSSTIRVAQLVGGRRTGCWDTSELIPNLIRTSIAVGAIGNPNALIPWVTVPDAARVILDDALAESFTGANVYNLEHPRPVSFSALVDYFNDALVHQGILLSPLSVVPTRDWIPMLQKTITRAGVPTPESASKTTALFVWGLRSTRIENPRLADLPALQMDKLLSRSVTLAKLIPLEAEDVARWVEYWVGIGFLERCSLPSHQQAGGRSKL